MNKVIIDWYYDDLESLNLIYVNNKAFRFGSDEIFDATKLVVDMREFCLVAGIEFKVKQHKWSYSSNLNPKA